MAQLARQKYQLAVPQQALNSRGTVVHKHWVGAHLWVAGLAVIFCFLHQGFPKLGSGPQVGSPNYFVGSPDDQLDVHFILSLSHK